MVLSRALSKMAGALWLVSERVGFVCSVMSPFLCDPSKANLLRAGRHSSANSVVRVGGREMDVYG